MARALDEVDQSGPEAIGGRSFDQLMVGRVGKQHRFAAIDRQLVKGMYGDVVRVDEALHDGKLHDQCVVRRHWRSPELNPSTQLSGVIGVVEDLDDSAGESPERDEDVDVCRGHDRSAAAASAAAERS